MSERAVESIPWRQFDRRWHRLAAYRNR